VLAGRRDADAEAARGTGVRAEGLVTDPDDLTDIDPESFDPDPYSIRDQEDE
jgi:hypothetical protein